MPRRLTHYDPDQIVIMAAGVRIQGFADGEFVTVEQLSDAFNDEVGTDGEVTRSKSNDRRATVTLKLAQTSISNDVLAAVHRADLNAPNGAGVFPFSMVDLLGTTIIEGSKAWVVRAPNASFDRTPKAREWAIRIATVDRFDGGHVV